MGNKSNSLSGNFDRTDTGGNKWRISWQITQNYSDFTWTINVKYYLNTGFSGVYITFKPKLQIGDNIYTGSYGDHGGSNSFVLLMEKTVTIPCSSTGRYGLMIYGFLENSDGDTWTQVEGALTFPSFSGAFVKVNGEWKKSMPWIKIDGKWKRCKQYIKTDNQWKLSNQVWLWDPF